MIAFGCAITDAKIYERCAAPGIRVAAEPDSEILAYGAVGSIFRSYNLLLDRAAELEQLEALVLLHQDAEIVDPDFCEKAREALRDPEVALVGCAGAIGVRNIAWWQGSVTWASFTHRYKELGGGEIPALSWKRDEIPAHATTGEVDTVDGFVMAVSPWAVRELRFDESLGQALHGYDFDYCLQAREAGRKVVTADFRVVHHHSMRLIGNVDELDRSPHQDRREVGRSRSGRRRGRRRLEAASSTRRGRSLRRSHSGRGDEAPARSRAQEERVRALEMEIAGYRNSKSWRMMAPARWLGRWLRRLLRPGSKADRARPGHALAPRSAQTPSRDGRPADAVRRSPQKL